ncbi:MAG: peroxiredoxin [Firmicutes bacterium]|nr:peroxiredoxin [Bacillota bacterium]
MAIGDLAPKFSLPDQDGAVVNLKDYVGKNVVLYFYPKDDTPKCTIEACSFRDNLREYQTLNAVVLGVSKDSAASHRRFADKYNLNFPLLSDEDLAVAKAYGVYRRTKNSEQESWEFVRSTFLIDGEGRLAQIWYDVQVDGHADAVREAITKLN